MIANQIPEDDIKQLREVFLPFLLDICKARQKWRRFFEPRRVQTRF